MITIFTPTFNRAYIISDLYKSLLRQTHTDFEWLIVDDGSTDGTEALITSFIEEGKIMIRFYKQINGGKHTAINKGVALAKGELFFIVDSDDYLVDNALERVFIHYGKVIDDSSFIGVSGMRYNKDGIKIGTQTNFNIIDCPPSHFGALHQIHGDNAEVFKTSILKKYPFPVIEGEKFCPEFLIWNRISKKYKMRFFNEAIYICEYLPDGLTASSVKRRIENPNYTMLTYSETYFSNISILMNLKSGINFWRFWFHTQKCKISIKKPTFLLLPLGYMMYLTDKNKLK